MVPCAAFSRFYHNTFEDSFRQECVDLLVGQHRLSGVVGVSESGKDKERLKAPQSAQQMSKHLTATASKFAGSQPSRTSRRKSHDASPPRADATYMRSSSGSTNSSSSESREKSSVPFRVWIGTWNVAGRDIHEWDHLEDWLTPVNEQADIFVFCVQELVSGRDSPSAALAAGPLGAANCPLYAGAGQHVRFRS